MKTITGTIKQGKVEIEANGFEGTGCVEATRAYLEQLSREQGEQRLKEEYFLERLPEQQ